MICLNTTSLHSVITLLSMTIFYLFSMGEGLEKKLSVTLRFKYKLDLKTLL